MSKYLEHLTIDGNVIADKFKAKSKASNGIESIIGNVIASDGSERFVTKFISNADVNNDVLSLNTINGDNLITFLGNGNVGIGTTIPSEKLEVNGNVLADSFITSGGTSSQFVKGDGSLDANSYDNYSYWNLKTNNVQRKTIQSGNDLDLVASTDIAISYSAGGVVNIAHGNTSSASSVNNSGGSVIQDIGIDERGHLISMQSVDLDSRYASSDAILFVEDTGVRSTVRTGFSSSADGDYTMVLARSSDIAGNDSGAYSGYNIEIDANSYRSAGLGGYNNLIKNAQNSAIVGSQQSIIDGVSNPAINSAIVGGYKNLLKDVNRSVILGGESITADEDDMVYGPNYKVMNDNNTDDAEYVPMVVQSLATASDPTASDYPEGTILLKYE